MYEYECMFATEIFYPLAVVCRWFYCHSIHCVICDHDLINRLIGAKVKVLIGCNLLHFLFLSFY